MLLSDTEVKMSAKYRQYSYTAKRKHRNKILFIIFLVISVFLIHTLVTSYLIKTFKIQSDTMEPEICKGDRILVTPIYSKENSLERGDVIITAPDFGLETGFWKNTLNTVMGFFTFQFFRPFDFQNKTASKYTIRRIIGLPGDTVYMKDFILYIKTQDAEHFLTEFELTDKDYNPDIMVLPNNWDKDRPFSGNYPQITLKEDEYFVLCDNRIASDDSRIWGPIRGDKRIYGRILFRYWPFNKFKIYR